MIAGPERVWLVAIAATFAACGSPPAPPPPPPPKPAAAPTAPSTATRKPPAPPPTPEVSYEAKGRRDPFEAPEARQAAAGGPSVATARLTGIVRGAQATLALVETADGIGYILRQGDTLGDGRLVEIGTDSVVFTIVPRPGSTTTRVTLKLASN